MSSARLLLGWTRTQNRIFWRTPIGAFFTLAFPVLMIALFVAVFGNEAFDTVYGEVTTSQFYVVGLAAYSAVSATYINIAMTLASRRELGVLKRVRGTPLPPWVYLGSVVLSSVWIALLGVALMLTLGVAAYGVEIDPAKAPALAVAFVVGAATFSVLGLALSSLAPSVSAAVPAGNATILPLAFVSDIFVPFGSDAPRWLATAGDLFPLKHFVRALGETMSPSTAAPALPWGHCAVMLAWMACGAAVAFRKFRWELPEPSDRPARRRRRMMSKQQS